jgi:hypothetical protein|nr:hypothetical protein [Algoriphagus sp.]
MIESIKNRNVDQKAGGKRVENENKKDKIDGISKKNISDRDAKLAPLAN